MCVICHHKAVFLAHVTHPIWVNGGSASHLLTQGPNVLEPLYVEHYWLRRQGKGT